MRRQAHEMALSGHGDLQSLPNPPGRIGCEPGAVADVEPVNRLHQAADGFLQEVRIAKGVMAEALGHMGGEPNVGGSQAVLAMDIAVMDLADSGDFAGFVVAVVADKLSHRPRLKDGSLGAQLGEIADKVFHQLALAAPEG